MHLFRPYLHLHDARICGKDGRVERLIAVRFLEGDVILEFSRHRFPERVDDAEDGVTVIHRFHNDPQSRDIVYLRYVVALALQFLVQTPKSLDANVGTEMFESPLREFLLKLALDIDK